MFNELEYIDQRISIYNKLIQKQEQKIKNQTFDYEPLYEMQVLKRLYTKRNSLQYKKDKLLNTMK